MAHLAMRLGIISAVEQEQRGLIDQIDRPEVTIKGMREYTHGILWGVECVCVVSRIGKVAAAATAAILIERFGVTHIVFTGVAGSADPSVSVGDIVIADELIQHDLDSSPLYPRFEIPLTGLTRISSDLLLTEYVNNASAVWLMDGFNESINANDRQSFRIKQPRIHRGLIASGDEFVNSSGKVAKLKQALPDLLAIEMEGAAVAQVCFECGVAFAVVRVISDVANEDAPIDFLQFIERVAAHYSFNIVRRVCTEIREIQQY